MDKIVRLYEDSDGTYSIGVYGIQTCLLDTHAMAEKINIQRKDFRVVGGIPMCNIFNILGVSELIPRSIKHQACRLSFTDNSEIEIFPDRLRIIGLEKMKNYVEYYDSLTGAKFRMRPYDMDLMHEASKTILGLSLGERYKPRPVKVIFNNPATIVIWSDGTKTVVKCGPNDTYSKEAGLALCYMKKTLGNKGNYNNMFRRWIKDE